jgi:urease accessory protein
LHSFCTRAARPAAIVFSILGLVSLGCDPALAHHPMGGVTPTNFIHGLLSGLGHPIIGLDHFAAIVAAGCLAATLQRGALVAVIYVLAMLAGAAAHVQAVSLPAGEMLVALSLLVVGAFLVLARPNFAVAALLFGCAGAIHGHALGESISGAEATPLYAYFLGLAFVHSALIVGIVLLVRQLMARQWLESARVQLVGAVVIGIGLAGIAQQLLPAA